MVNRLLVSRLALCACFFALGVIALGAFTRLIDAGLGCPDWPGCYGHLVVTDSPFVAYKAWAEMVHRYFVGGLSLFLLVIVGIIFSKREIRIRSNVVLAMGLILLLIYQIALGRWTVTMKLLPVVVSQHLLGGFLILSTLWLLYLNNKVNLAKNAQMKKNSGMFVLAIIGLILLFLQIMLGAWTSTNYASLSCPDFPFCVNEHPYLPMYFNKAFTLLSPIGVNYEGGVLPEAVRQTIQMTHRIGALIVFVYMFIFGVIAMQKFKNHSDTLKVIYVILGLLTIQVCIGIANIILKLPVVSAVSHNLVAALLLLSVITLVFKLATNKRSTRKVSES